MIDAKQYKPVSKKVRHSGLVTARSSRVFMAPDHVLLTVDEHFTEKYRRFYFQDIRSIEIARTSTREIGNWIILGFIACFLFLLAVGILFMRWGAAGAVIVGVFMFPLVLIAFV